MINYILSILFGLITLSKSNPEFSGQWIALCKGCKETTLEVTKGVSYGSEYKSAEEASTSMSVSVSAGFKFLGIGTSVEMSGSIGKTVSEEISIDYAESTTIKETISCEYDLYQFEMFGPGARLKSSHTLCSKTPPLCLPGKCQSDGKGGYKNPDPKKIDIWRYFHHNYDDHMSSYDSFEEIAIAAGYIREHFAFKLFDYKDQTVSNKDYIPLYRLYDGKDHMISINPTEGNLNGYKYERTLGYCSSTKVKGSVPIYRQWAQTGNDHMASLHSTAESSKYMVEKIICYGWIN